MIIPVHNVENTLERCVDSFTVQGYSDLELILVENNSSDDSWQLCRELARRYSQVVCVQTERRGLSAARNIGLDQATGDIIGFADSDDAVSSDTLEKVRQAFEHHPECSAVVTGFSKVYMDGRQKRYNVARERVCSFQTLLHHVLCDSRVSGYAVNKFWKRDVLETMRFRTDVTKSEDTHFAVNVLTNHRDRRACILPENTYMYYQHPGSITAQWEGMFDEAGRLKMILDVQTIRGDFRLNGYERFLTRRLIFSMASSQYLRFRDQLTQSQRVLLKAEMRKNLWCYLLSCYVAPVETCKRLLRLLLPK